MVGINHQEWVVYDIAIPTLFSSSPWQMKWLTAENITLVAPHQRADSCCGWATVSEWYGKNLCLSLYWSKRQSAEWHVFIGFRFWCIPLHLHASRVQFLPPWWIYGIRLGSPSSPSSPSPSCWLTESNNDARACLAPWKLKQPVPLWVNQEGGCTK